MENITSENGDIKELLNLLNELRTNPKKFANKITLIMSYINKRDNTLRLPNKPAVVLIEGIKSYEEAITLLKNTDPLDSLVLEESMSKISHAYAIQLGQKANEAESNSMMEDRFRRFGTFNDLKQIAIQGDNELSRIIINLIVCDGDPSRTNRNIILSPHLKQIGIGRYDNLKNCFTTVFNLAENWKPRQPVTESPKIKERKKEIVSNLINIKKSEEEIKKSLNNSIFDKMIEKYDQELDAQLHFDKFNDKTEEKQIIQEGNKFKLIKKITLTLPDDTVRRVILSKTWYVKNL